MRDDAVALQYLYYLAQLPISVSPISNSELFLKRAPASFAGARRPDDDGGARRYAANPFPKLFKRGLCVALTTDDPLMFHTTPTPLLEEYATARHAFALSTVDLCEIARSSCVGAFSEEERADLHSDDAIDCTNVPLLRLAFRRSTLDAEYDFLESGAGRAAGKSEG